MTYDPLIPAAGDVLSQSQQDIQTNFSQANTIFGSDHVEFDDSTASNRGLHKQVTMFEALVSAPTPINAQGIIYPLADVNDTSLRTQIYFKNQSNSIQITNRFKSAATNGYVMIPGNISSPSIIYMWGNISSTLFTNSGSGSFYDLTLTSISNYTGSPVGFPTNIFNIQLTLSTADFTAKSCTVDNGNPITTSGFRILCSAAKNAFDSIYWYVTGN